MNAFQAAALDPQLWPTALEALAEATGSRRAQLIGIGPGFEKGFNWVNEAPVGMVEAFAAVEQQPELSFRVMASQRNPNAEVVYEADYGGARRFLARDEYLDLCSDWDILHGCQTNLKGSSEGLIGLALLRTRRDGPTDVAVRESFSSVIPIARAAVALQIATEERGHELVAGALEAVGAACFVLDKHWRTGAMTPAAEALVAQGHLTLADGRPLPCDSASARRLEGAREQLSKGQSLGFEMMAPSRDGPIRLTLSSLPQREWQLGFGPRALLTVKLPPRLDELDAESLRAAFGLTKAEAAVAQLMIMGHRRDAIARIRGTGPETLRSQMRSIFAKLDVRRETDAIGILHAFVR